MKYGFLYGKTYRAILIGLFVLIAIFTGIFAYDVYQLQNFLPIATLDFPEDDWIKVNSAKIYHYSYEQAISPNDQLTLQLNVTNKKQIRFYVEPKIYLDVGGEVLKKRENFGAIQLGINSTGELSPYAFFAANEGQNNIRVLLALSSFNGTFIKYENATTSFQVISPSDKLLHDQNNTVLLGVIFSGIIGIATVLALFGTKRSSDRHATELRTSNDFLKKQTEISAKQMDALQEQNQLYRDQFSSLNRPWISLSNLDPLTHEPNYLMVPLKNYGKTPAVNIKTKYHVKEGNFTVDELQRDGKSVDTASMTPDEIWTENLEMSSETYTKMLSTDNCYFGLYIEYSYETGKTGVTTIICQIKKGTKEISYKIKDLK